MLHALSNMKANTKGARRSLALTSALSGGLLAGFLVAAPAYAGEIINGQVQLNDVWTNLDVRVGTVRNLAGGSTATGNSLTTGATGRSENVTSSQVLRNSTKANVTAVAGSIAESAALTSTAFGNAQTSYVTNGNLTSKSEQVADAKLMADLSLDVAGNVASSYVGSTAISNAQSLTTSGGALDASARQSATWDNNANATLRAGSVSDSSSTSSVAVANSVTTESSNGQKLEVDQRSFGYNVGAATAVAVGEAKDTLGSSNAIGNSISAWNANGNSSLTATQQNDARINAWTEVRLGSFTGLGASSAYGVGNSSIQSNLGGVANINTNQSNWGGVQATASFTGVGAANNSTALASATAFGNISSGIVGDASSNKIRATNNQLNNGYIGAEARIRADAAQNAIGSASAFGNAASYTSNSGGD